MDRVSTPSLLSLDAVTFSCLDVEDEAMKLDRRVSRSKIGRLGKVLHVVFDGLLEATVLRLSDREGPL